MLHSNCGPRKKMSRKKVTLVSRTVDVTGLTMSLIESAFKLYQQYYDDVSFEKFHSDLSQKQKVIVIFEKSTGILRGFSALLIKNLEIDGKKVRVIYSGDTIIDEAHRGSRALTSEFFKNIVLERIKNPLTPVWWFLISKGYKTYLLLANNYNHYYPRVEVITPKFYQDLLDKISLSFFGENYDPSTGIISFSNKSEKLKDFTAPITEGMISKYPKIKFFVEKNPSWQEGDELACIGEVNWSLLLTYPYKVIKKIVFKGFSGIFSTTH